MKIVKRGLSPHEQLWAGKCTACKSEMEADGHELVENIKSDRDGAFAYLPCPVCGERFFLHPKKPR